MNCPYCNKKFKTWKSVRGHTAHCNKNNGEYFIDLVEGCIHYKELNCYNVYSITSKFPNLASKVSDIKKSFKRRNINVEYKFEASKEDIINNIQNWVHKYEKIPESRDFARAVPGQFTHKAIKRLFGTWNNAIEAAGFKPNLQNGFGIDTFGLDGHLYRSQAEAYFADNYLYNKYDYYIEPKYAEGHNRYYDWYIKELDLYIELDGGIRPEVIKEKIQINKELNRNLVIIPTVIIRNPIKVKLCMKIY